MQEGDFLSVYLLFAVLAARLNHASAAPQAMSFLILQPASPSLQGPAILSWQQVQDRESSVWTLRPLRPLLLTLMEIGTLGKYRRNNDIRLEPFGFQELRAFPRNVCLITAWPLVSEVGDASRSFP